MKTNCDLYVNEMINNKIKGSMFYDGTKKGNLNARINLFILASLSNLLAQWL